MRRRVFMIIWMALFGLYGFLGGAADVAHATQHYTTCWTSGQGQSSCFGATSWQLDYDTYEAWAGSWSYGLDIYKSANGHGTNWYHTGQVFEQALCDAGG